MIDLNTATPGELDAVPAREDHGHEVVHPRAERGRFTSLRQLDEVPGPVGKTDATLAEAVRVSANGA